MEITDATFEAEVIQSDKPVLVDFWAPWCAPCRTVGAVLDQLSGERDDLKIVKINIDDNQDQALKHSVLVLPTVVLYMGGEAVGKLQGGVPPTAIARLLQEHLPADAPAAAEAEPALATEEASPKTRSCADPHEDGMQPVSLRRLHPRLRYIAVDGAGRGIDLDRPPETVVALNRLAADPH